MKIWFVTGASRGFGSLVTEHALTRGDAVAATARNPKTLTNRFGDRRGLARYRRLDGLLIGRYTGVTPELGSTIGE